MLVSRYDHCLLDLLWRWRRGELEGQIVLVASNHPDLRADVEIFDIPYHHVPVDPDHKPAAEAKLLELLEGKCDLVVLARYMQILSGEFLERVAVPVINIHHSFLPAFAGADPYEHAKARGVKLIGATAHYVTEELDAGPIIEQDVMRVSHRDDVASLARSAPTSSARCWRAPSRRTARTACSSTARRPWCSEGCPYPLCGLLRLGPLGLRFALSDGLALGRGSRRQLPLAPADQRLPRPPAGLGPWLAAREREPQDRPLHPAPLLRERPGVVRQAVALADLPHAGRDLPVAAGGMSG